MFSFGTLNSNPSWLWVFVLPDMIFCGLSMASSPNIILETLIGLKNV
jgi:hypothetical protein